MAKTIASQDLEIRDLKNKLQAKEHELIMTKADLCRGCQYRNDYKNLFKTYKVKEQECEKNKKDNSEYYSIYKEENIKLNNAINEIEDFCELACPVKCRKIDCGVCDNIEPFEVIKAIKSVINKLQEKTNE